MSMGPGGVVLDSKSRDIKKQLYKNVFRVSPFLVLVILDY